MKYIVVALGVVSEETRLAIDQVMSTVDYEVVNYDLRGDDAENEKRTTVLQYHTPPSKSYLRWRLTELLKTRVRYDPPCDLTAVAAVVYDAAQAADESMPDWNEVALAFRASVYQVARRDDGKLSAELEAVPD